MTQSSGMTIAVAATFTAFQFLGVFLRLLARIKKRLELGLDDYFIIAASMFFVCIAIVTFIQCAAEGLGDHAETLANGEIRNPSYLWSVTERIFEGLTVLPVGFAKLSVLYFYKRIFRGRSFTVINYILITLVAMWIIGFTFASLFPCSPFELYLRQGSRAPGVHCLEPTPMYYGLVISDFLVDIAIVAVPIPLVLKLKLPLRQKVAVCGIFMLGFLTIAASIARMQSYIETVNLHPYQAADYTWVTAPPNLWALIEGSLAIVSACLPTLRPIFHGVSPESILRSFRSRVLIGSSSSASMPRSLNNIDVEKTVDVEYEEVHYKLPEGAHSLSK